MDIQLSVILPAYNEARRISPFLASIRGYLDGRCGNGYEVIVVDDGSRDGMLQGITALQADWPQLLAVQHTVNRGKGAAVRTGMLAARGQLLLYADADGATAIEEQSKLAAAIEDGADVAVGSRLVAEEGVSRERTRVRGLAGRVFAHCARRWLGIAVRDTQCGFKLFRGDVGRELYAQGRETGYLFDLEMLMFADHLGYRVAEVPVNWNEVPGGHMNLLRDSAKMLFGLPRLRRRLLHRAATSK
jgi:dolichyl-phosphate beta-glucosyltransferase